MLKKNHFLKDVFSFMLCFCLLDLILEVQVKVCLLCTMRYFIRVFTVCPSTCLLVPRAKGVLEKACVDIGL